MPRGDRERRAGQQLVGAGVRAVVGQRPGREQDRGGGADGGEHEDGAEQQARGARARRQPARARPQPEQQRRPHEVELLLDGQRPEVDERARHVAGREVVALGQAEMPVDAVQRGERGVVADRRVVDAVQQPERADDHDGEHEHRGRQQPAHAARVEAREVDAASARELVDEQARDEVAGEDEEDVDADEATGNPGVAEVKGDHEDHGDRADPVELRPIPARAGVGALGQCSSLGQARWRARRMRRGSGGGGQGASISLRKVDEG